MRSEQADYAFALVHSGPKSVRCEHAGDDRTGVNVPDRDGRYTCVR